MEKTVKQLADKYNISKQAIRARVKKLSIDCYHVDSNGMILINEKGQKILDDALSNKGGKKSDNVDSNVIDTLIEQLHTKDAQIEKLQKALDQAQQLQALAENKIRQLEDKQQVQQGEDPRQDTEPTPKKHWWQFMR